MVARRPSCAVRRSGCRTPGPTPSACCEGAALGRGPRQQPTATRCSRPPRRQAGRVLVVVTRTRAVRRLQRRTSSATAESWAKRNQAEGSTQVHLTAVGQEGPRVLQDAGYDLTREWIDSSGSGSTSTAKRGIADSLVESLPRPGESTRSVIVYNEFKSAIQARPVVLQLLAGRAGGGGPGGRRGRRGVHLRAIEPRGEAPRRPCCRTTSGTRSTRRCSSPAPPSTRRAWRRWMRPRTTRAS